MSDHVSDGFLTVLRDVGREGRGLPSVDAGSVRSDAARRRRRHYLAGAAAVVAVLALGAVPVVQRQWTLDPAANVSMSCPAEYEGTEQDLAVPDAAPPEGFDPGDALAPSEAPSAAVICVYPAGMNADPSPPPVRLGDTLPVDSGLEQMAKDLSSAPAGGEAFACTEMGGPATRHLIGLDYPSGRVWIAVPTDPNHCVPASNGDFTTGPHLGKIVDQAVADGGRWPTPTQGGARSAPTR